MEHLTGMMTEDDFLEHYGKKGMKWGQRKASSNPAHTSADAARFNKIKTRSKTKGLDNLSNDDLAKLNKRNQLLSEYKKNNPSKIKKGRDATKEAVSVVKDIKAVAAIGIAGYAFVKSPVGQKAVKAVVGAISNLK